MESLCSSDKLPSGELLLTERLTFPQIWVERVCESSEDEDEDLLDAQRAERRKNKKNLLLGSTRPKDKVIRSLLLTSSNDVSFESTSSSNGESRQSSFQLSCSLDQEEDEVYQTPTVDKAATAAAAALVRGEESSSSISRGDFHTPVARAIEEWLQRIEVRGFQASQVMAFAKGGDDDDNDDGEDDDTWFEQDLVRVFDPYYGVLDEDEIAECDSKSGKPAGRCTVTLKNGDELMGTWCEGVRNGRGSIEGANLLRHGLVCVRGNYDQGVLTGLGSAVIAEGSMWHLVNQRIHLKGVFNDGYLEGPVRGVDELGGLVFVGQYHRGLPIGPCWLAREGQGWLYGQVDEKGRFSGENIAFVYPDRVTSLVGHFYREVMLRAFASRITKAEVNGAHILCLAIAVKDGEDSPSYSYCPSDSERIHCDWTLRDCYESVTVVTRVSSVNGAGEGLFARSCLPKDRVVAYYNGVRVAPGQCYSNRANNYDYQIYVDWGDTDRSDFVDVPAECTNNSTYCASLAHKANHSFRPNCRYVAVQHPRFGRVPALQTITHVAEDEELFSHYKYDMALAPNWYQQAWEGIERSDGEEEKGVEDRENDTQWSATSPVLGSDHAAFSTP